MTSFPVIASLSEMKTAYDAVQEDYKKRKLPFSFFEKQTTDGYTFFNYRYMTPFTFPELSTIEDEEMRRHQSLLRECRGIVFDTQTGKLVSRPFHKFFNVNERYETLQEKLDLSQSFHLLEKVDGTMVCPVITRLPNEVTANNEQLYTLHFRTKMGWDTDIALHIEKLLFNTTDQHQRPKFTQSQNGTFTLQQSDSTQEQHSSGDFQIGRDVMWNYINHSVHWISQGYTPIYEFASPDNTIVLFYSQPILKLLAIRHVETGHYVPYEESLRDAQHYNIPVVSPIAINGGMEEVMETIKNMSDVEGFVLRFARSGNMYKIKSSWYVDKHKRQTKSVWGTLDEAGVYKAVALGTIDDVIAGIDDQEGKDVMNDFNTVFWRGVNLTCVGLMNKVEQLRRDAESQGVPEHNQKRWLYECLSKEKVNRDEQVLLTSLFHKKQDESAENIVVAYVQTIFKRQKGKKIPEVISVLEKYSGLEIAMKKSQYQEVKKRNDDRKRADHDKTIIK